MKSVISLLHTGSSRLGIRLTVLNLFLTLPLGVAVGANCADDDEVCAARDLSEDGRDGGESQMSLLQRRADLRRQAAKRSAGNGSPYAEKLIEMAALEENMNTSVQDSCLPKWPRSWIDQIDAIENTMSHNFNFIGSIFRSDIVRESRLWVLDFAQEHFLDSDFLRVTDPEYVDGGYESLGTFDHTLEDDYESERPNKLSNLINASYEPVFDTLYWTVMAQSNFTLCPRGDKPDSFRFFEALLAGSIPIVEEHDHTDWGTLCHVSSTIGWKYYLLSDAPDAKYEYRPDWVAQNKALATKYLTYMEGYHTVESS